MANIIRTGTSRGAHLRALHAALLQIEDLLGPEPNHKRVAIRDHRAALERAHPELRLDVAEEQHLAEEDGDGVED